MTGRTSVLLLALGLVAAGLGALLLFGGRGRGAVDGGTRVEPGRATPEAPRLETPAPGPTSAPRPDDRASDTPEPERLPSDLGTLQPGEVDERRFEGLGSLRGHVQVVEASTPPIEWRLELIPSRIYAGSEHALERTQTFDATSFDFEVEGLPFGAYDVRAIAEGFNGSWVPIVIERTSPNPFVNLRLRGAGFLEGQLVDADGNAIEGVPVVLVGQADGSRYQERSDAFGRYRFEAVPDGTYELVLGPPESPLGPPERLDFRAPSMTLPPTELRGLVDVRVVVLDIDEEPILDARVHGSSTGGGNFDLTTDEFGNVLIENLGAGKVRLRVEHVAYESARRTIDVERGTDRDVLVYLRPPQ